MLNGTTWLGRVQCFKCRHNHHGDDCNSRLNGSNQKAAPEHKSVWAWHQPVTHWWGKRTTKRSDAESELSPRTCPRPLLAVLARVVISRERIEGRVCFSFRFMHRYRLTFLPWSWPPFIKSNTDIPAGSAPPPPTTQNGPRINTDLLVMHFA